MYTRPVFGRSSSTLAAVLLFSAALVSGCSDRASKQPDPGANRDTCEQFPAFCQGQTGDFLFQVGRALDSAGSYHLVVSQANFVLPRWGGSDGGDVSVNLKTGEAVANLQRTGDGQYAIVLTSGETYFQRSTCPDWAKIQDGAAVLAPFILTSDELQHSKLTEVTPSTPESKTHTVKLELQGVGPVSMEVEKATARPVRITSETLTGNGKPLEWSFSAWGEPVKIPPVSSTKLSGPGGNPC